MSTSVATDFVTVRGPESRRAAAFRACTRALRTLKRRHWLVAASLGVVIGILYAASVWLGFVQRTKPTDRLPALAVMTTRWVLLMLAVSCALAFGVALLRDIGQRGAIRPRHVTLTVLAVIAVGAMADPIAVYLSGALSAWLRPDVPFFTGGSPDWLTTLSRMYTLSMDKVFVVATTATLSAVYYFKISRTTDALATAQMGLSEARSRTLREELRSAQAAVDPEFLFATLAEIDRRFESDPQVAQQLLDALIRYLRAALPTSDEVIGTLGQQVVLVRAYLDIEMIRSTGRLQGAIDMPRELEARPFAPALVLPLVALAASRDVETADDTNVDVRVSAQDGWLVIEVHANGSQSVLSVQQESTLASLRQRVLVLYGSDAKLSFTRGLRGSSAKLVIAEPEAL